MANQGLNGINPLAYMGVNPTTPALTQTYTRAPTSNDSIGFQIGDVWVEVPAGYSGPEKVYILISLNQNQATWAQIYPGSASSLQFETDAGTVNPVAGVVNVVGDGVKINTSGTGNTITISADSDVANDYVTDSGTASPSSSVLNVVGGSNINTAGASNTVTINLNDDVTIANNLTVTNDSTFLGSVQVAPFAEGVVQSNSLGVLSSSAGTNGQVLIGDTGGAPAWANIISSDASVTIVNNANSIDLQVAGGGGGNTIVSTFTSSGTWTKNVSTNYVEVYGVCGGGGGASGSVAQIGGGGGGTWGSFYIEGPSFVFPSSVAVTVGAGGTGGASTSGTSFNDGGDGGLSFFGNTSSLFNATPSTEGYSGARGVTGGSWGTLLTDHGYCVNMDGYHINSGTSIFSHQNDSGLQGGYVPRYQANGYDGVLRGKIKIDSTYPVITFLLSGGGGGGGSFYNSVAGDGGAGGGIYAVDGTELVAPGSAGLSAGPKDGGDGSDGLQGVGIFTAGSGGGGGGYGVTSPGGNGGNGGFPGGGGGGGGGCNAPGNSGSGGNGADGVVIVIEYT